MKAKSLNSRNLFSVTATLMLTAAAAQAQSAFTNALMNLSPGPVGYWPLQETTQPPAAYVETNIGGLGPDANAYYISTNVQILSLTPQVPFPADSSAGVNLPGNGSSFMVVPTTDNRVSLPPGKPFTVELWVQPTTFNSYVCPIDQSGPFFGSALNPGLNGATNGNAGWMFGQAFLPRDGQPGFANHLFGWSFHVFNGVGTGGAEADAAYEFTTNNWYHIVGVFDGVNCSVYVNGSNTTSIQFPMHGSFVPDTWDPIQIGCNRGYGSNPYHGCVAEIAIYTNALSALVISNDYQAGLGGSGYTNVIMANNPYMYWRLAAPAYTVPATNTYPAANNYGSDSDPNIAGLYQPGTLPGAPGPQFSGMGSATNAVAFNGMNSAVMAWTNNNSISSPLNVTNKSISMACWFKGNPADLNVRTFQGIVSRGNNGWHLSLGPNGFLHWAVGVGGDLVSTWPYNDGNWHFVVAEYLNTGTVGPGGAGWTATNLLYVDGYLDSSALMTNNETGSVTNGALFFGGDPSFAVANLGVNAGYNSSQRYLAGSVAQVAYFTNALTASQVQSLYNTAAPNVAPYIIGQPTTGRTVAGGPGTFVFFGVVASGTGPLGYQWYFNTTSNYSGATSLVNDNVNYFNEQTYNMTVSNLVNSESGYYYVVINNAYGHATSALASITVSAAPIITSQAPSGAFSMFTNQTSLLSLSVFAPATSPLTFQWYTNGVADTTAGTSSNYFASAQAAANNETYQCIVANTFGSATSAVDTLTLQSLPISLTSSAYANNLMALNPTAYWPMHEKEAAVLGDVETNYGSLGALGNGFYQDWAGPSIVVHNSAGAIAGDSDSAATFSGVNNTALVVPHRSPLMTIKYPYTLEAWVKPVSDNAQGLGSYMVIMGQGGASGLNLTPGRAGFALQYSGTPDTFSLVLWTNTSNGNTYEQKTVSAYPPGQWYHLVVTYDGTNVTYFVNGQQAGYLAGPTTSGFPSQMQPDSWSPLVVGAGRWGTTGTAQGFDGEIDEVALYTNLLTQQQIQDDFLAGTTVSSNYFQTVIGNNPYLYYRMDSPPYTPPPVSSLPVLTNYGSVAVNGVYAPGAMPGADAGPGAQGAFALNMDGTNAMAGNGVSSFADAGIQPQLNPVTTNSFSYTAWFRGYPCDDRNFNHIMAANDSSWRVCLNSSGEVLAHGNADESTTVTNNDGGWHQFVLTAQAGITNGVWAGNFTNDLYVDGVLIKSQINTGSNTVGNSPGPEVLLGDEWGKTNPISEGNGGRSFAGDMCEAAFFDNTVLTPAQIQSLYGSAGIKPSIVVQPATAIAIVTLAYTNSVSANGTQPLYFQWYTNGVAIGTPAGNISGETTNDVVTDQLIVNPVQFQDLASYYVVVTNVYGAVTSSVVTLSGISTPIITNALPMTYTNLMTLYAGVSPSFSVQAVGSPPLTYYWYTNSVADQAVQNVNPGFTFSNAQAAFNVYCVVSNTFGTVQSRTWSAQILPDPTNAYQMTVLAANPADYWRLDDTNLAGFDNGAGDDGYVANDYINGNNGTYTNTDLANGNGISSFNPAADSTDVGANFNFISSSSDANSIMAPDFNAPNGVNAEFTVSAWAYPTAVEPGNAGIVNKGLFNQEEYNIDCGGQSNSFRFECRNAAGTDSSAAAGLAVSFVNPSTIDHWYHLVGVCDEANGVVQLYVNGRLVGHTTIATGTGLFNSSGTPVSFGSRASATPYFFGDDNQQFSGYISDVAIFKYAMTPNQVASLYSGAGNITPFFVQTPAITNSTSAGANMTNSPALAGGTGPLTYWWLLVTNGATISNVVSGSTGGDVVDASFVESNVPASWNGDQLELVVSNSLGGTNLFVNLNVATVPTIVTNLPLQVYILSNRYYTYSPLVNGSLPLKYQWYNNNAPIAGQTNSTYSFLTGSPSTNSYYFIVTNNSGSATSIVSTVTVISSYQSLVLSNGPVAYWPLNETPDNKAGNNGVVAHDISGNANNMFYTNCVIGLPGIGGDPFTVAQFGTFATSYSMAEESSANGVPDISQLAGANGGNGEFTVEAWTAPTAGQALNDRIVDCGHFFNEEWALDLGTTSPGEAFRFTIRNGAGGEFDARGTVVPDGNWHHVVGVCDEANQQVLLYVDGVLNASNNFGGTIAAASGIEEDDQPITIGNADASSTGVGQYTAQLVGKISDVAIYSTPLSASQILQHYQAVTAGVYPVPVVSTQLPLPNTNQFTLYKGVSPNFMAVASGIPPLTYQWYTNNVAVGGATNTTFKINNVQNNFSSYCIITNTAGSGTSMVWTASVIADPTDRFGATMLSNNPVAYWRLNESGGNTIANDYAGGANGVYGSSTAQGSPGVPLPGLPSETAVGMNNQAPSVNAGCVVNSGLILNTNTVTFLSWIYPTTSAEFNPSGIIFGRSGPTVGGSQIGAGNAFDYTWGNVPATYNFGSGLAVPANQWSLVALATTPSNAMMYVFNAGGVGSATNYVTNAVQSFFAGVDIGADPLSTNRIFQGEIGESAVFNYTLTSSQLSQMFNAATNAVVTGPSFTNAPPISFGTTANNQLSLTWPAKYVGYYYLQVQTNKLSVGINTNWIPYGGSIGFTLNAGGVTNSFSTNDCVFYRLMTNAP